MCRRPKTVSTVLYLVLNANTYKDADRSSDTQGHTFYHDRKSLGVTQCLQCEQSFLEQEWSA